MTTHSTIHDAASKGFQIAVDAYERGRPEYPVEAVNYLVRALGLQQGRTVVDVGAGTGKFTKCLVGTGAQVMAVEPVEGMRRKFSDLLPGVEILNGTAEAIPLKDGTADAIVAAQAFHWFSGEAAVREIHRVLKTGGKLGLIWNARDESLDWVAKLTEIIDPHEKGAPRYRTGKWKEAFLSSSLLGPLQREQFHHVHRGDTEMVVDRVGSISFISALPTEMKQKVLNEVRQLLASHPLTKDKREIDFPYRTDVFWCEKI